MLEYDKLHPFQCSDKTINNEYLPKFYKYWPDLSPDCSYVSNPYLIAYFSNYIKNELSDLIKEVEKKASL